MFATCRIRCRLCGFSVPFALRLLPITAGRCTLWFDGWRMRSIVSIGFLLLLVRHLLLVAMHLVLLVSFPKNIRVHCFASRFFVEPFICQEVIILGCSTIMKGLEPMGSRAVQDCVTHSVTATTRAPTMDSATSRSHRQRHAAAYCTIELR